MTIQPTDSPRFGLPQGVVAILATVFAMALTDAIIKLSSSGMTLWQIWILRSAIVVPILLVATKGRVLPPGTGWIIARSAALVVQYLCLYAVLPLMDMALAGAAFYTAPFFIVGLSALVLGNRITLRHWLAILTGFVDADQKAMGRPVCVAFHTTGALLVADDLSNTLWRVTPENSTAAN